MESNSEIVRSVSWRDLCPWLIIVRAIPVSTGMGILVLATLGVVLAPVGWWLSALIFVNSEMREADYHFDEQVRKNSNPYVSVFGSTTSELDLGLITSRIVGPVQVYQRYSEPFYHLFHDIHGLRRFCYYLFGCLWNLIIWAFLGAAICRIAFLRLCRGERIGIGEAFRFGLEQFPTTSAALLIPIVVVGVLCLPLFLVGLLMTFDIGLVIAAILWIFVAFLVLVCGVMLLGLAFGWPMMVASVSAEGQGALDSLTRSYAYTFQRPLNYLFYAIVAMFVGGLIWVIAARFTEGLIHFSYWSTSWGANVAEGERIEQIRYPRLFPEPDGNSITAEDSKTGKSKVAKKSDTEKEVRRPGNSGDQKIRPDQPAENSNDDNKDSQTKSAEPEQPDREESLASNTLLLGHRIIEFWNALLRTIAAGFLHGLFWCLVCAIYLLLRKDVDDTEMDDVFIEDERHLFDLPPLKNDQNDLPTIDSTESTEGEDEAPNDPGSENGKSESNNR